MELVEPKVYLVGETKINKEELQQYLKDIGASEWQSDAPSDGEKLIEVMGRLCYRSFKPSLNPNVTKVREHNDDYLLHILEVGHGSVIEHPYLNFIFKDVSRVFTHELVRHRVGDSFSQESLRFVRLDKLRFWMPRVFVRHPRCAEIIRLMMETVEYLEQRQLELAQLLEIDKEKKFDIKKKLTSAMRRIAPIGLATSIGFSANLRTLRHIIEMRTDPAAEEEIRLVFGKVANIVQQRYPNLFGDYEVEVVDDMPWYHTKNKKV